MTQLAISGQAAPRPYFRAGAMAIAVLVMTTIHHVYGAVIYHTPWRLHIVYISAPVAAAIVAALVFGASREGTPAGRVATWLAIAAIIVFPVALIGFFEGGYNHVVKNIVYFAAGEEAMMGLVPTFLYDPSAVEVPSDVFFEMTGIAQFPLSIATVAAVRRLARWVR